MDTRRKVIMNRSIKAYIKEEYLGWKLWEVVWLAVEWTVIFGVSVYWDNSIMEIISAVAGVTCVACTGKGKLSAYFFGMINIILYSIISYKARFYGEVMLNVIYYIPMQFYGVYVWSRHMNTETHEVEKREMRFSGKIILVISVIVPIIVYGFVLKLLGGKLPFADAMSTVVSVVAMIISVRMYIEQWLLWFVVDAVTVVMWAIDFMRGSDDIATLLMWSVYLINAIVMYIKWKKEIIKKRV